MQHDPVSDAVRARAQQRRAERSAQLEAELAKRPEVQELRAFFASPAGAQARQALVDQFLFADPPGLTDNEIAYWAGAQKVVKWILQVGAPPAAQNAQG